MLYYKKQEAILTEYIQCRNCQYWVLDNDKHCPHCGIKHPYKEKSPLLCIKLPGIILAGHICFYFIIELFTKYTIELSKLLLSMGGSVVITGLSGFLIDIKLKKQLHKSN